MDLIVRPDQQARWHDRIMPCAIGRNGIGQTKLEGDGLTPCGRFPLRAVLYRPDRIRRPNTILQCVPIAPADGWCEAPGDPNYNRAVTLSQSAWAESLWRDDHLYDLLAIIGYNDDPVVSGNGSAIFLHVAREGYAPTRGCVALSMADLAHVLGQWMSEDRIVIEAA